MLERADVSRFQRWARTEFPGCYLIKLESPSTSGILDVYFAYQGVSLWLEFKLEQYRNRQWSNRKIQEWHAKQLNANGVPAKIIFTLQEAKKFVVDQLGLVGHPYASK